MTGSGSPTRSTARSIGSGRSATDGKQGLSNTVARVGCTGCSRAPTRSAHATSWRVMPVFGRPSASDAPITATDTPLTVNGAYSGRTGVVVPFL